MKVIICGKGGCGKSTVASMLARAYEKEGKNVLVVDSDESNYGLYRQLGLDLPEDFTHYFGGKRGAGELVDDRGYVFEKKWHISDIPSQFLTGSGNLKLMAIGKIAEAEEGCACGMGFTAKKFLENLEDGENDIVITDTEAGVEHFGRGLDSFADVILMVIDPSYESICLSDKVYDMAKALDKPVYFILNKVSGDSAEITKSAIHNKDAVIAEIPSDTELMMAGLKGEKVEKDFPGIQTIVNTI